MSRWRDACPMAWIAGLCLVGLFGALVVSPAGADGPDPWAKKTQWYSLRMGYARSAASGAADGNLGFGFAYARFRNAKWSYGASAQLEVLGRYGDARETEVPWTVDITRHYRWNTPLRPYAGLGGGAYYHKVSGTGFDGASIVPGAYVNWGANSPISDHGLLGLDVRMNVVKANKLNDPVFGSTAVLGEHPSRVVHWSVKLSYAWVFQ